MNTLRSAGVYLQTEHDEAQFKKSVKLLMRLPQPPPQPQQTWWHEVVGEPVVRISAHDQTITPDILDAINSFPEIQHLSFNGSSLTDADFAELIAHRELLTLNLSNTRITDKSGVLLSRYRELTWCELENVAIADKTIGSLKHLKALEVLRVQGTAVTAQGLKQLEHLPNLKEARRGKSFLKPKWQTSF